MLLDSFRPMWLFAIRHVAVVALPISAPTTLVAAGGSASQRYFNLSLVLSTIFLGIEDTDATGYLLTRRYGTKVFHAVRLGKLLTTNAFTKLENYMRNFPQVVIFCLSLSHQGRSCSGYPLRRM